MSVAGTKEEGPSCCKETKKEDRALGMELSSIIGNTFIDKMIPPDIQWIHIIRTLRAHGFIVSKTPEGSKNDGTGTGTDGNGH